MSNTSFEDLPLVREAVSQILTQLGYKVSVYSSSRKLLEDVQKQPSLFDAVITDQTMPELTGIELIREIRRLNKTVPIILSTGFSEHVTTETARQYGIASILLKPVNRINLSTELNKALTN